MGAAYYGGMRRIGVLTAGCCVALMACSPAVDAPTTEESTPQVRLPRPGLAWNEDFASNTTLERINVGDDSLLVPLGIRLPDDATVTAITEVSLVLADDDPDGLAASVEMSCLGSGYTEIASGEDYKVWLGNGMVVRFEAGPGAQVLAWAPEAMLDSFVDQA